MPYFELPDDPELKPYLPYLKLILLYILLGRVKDFPIDTINMSNSKLQLLIVNAIQKALKVALPISIEDIQRRDNVIFELTSDYEPKPIFTLKNKLIDNHHTFITFSKKIEEYNTAINNDESGKELLPIDLIDSAAQYFEDKKTRFFLKDFPFPDIKNTIDSALIEVLKNKDIALLNETLLFPLIRKFVPDGITFIIFLITQFNISSETIFKLFLFKDAITFLSLYKAKPQLLQNLSPEIFCHINPNYNISAFYWLAGNRQGIELLADNPHLLKLVTQQALCQIHPTSNTSAFYWLAANKNGREILADNLHLLPLVTAEALCHINLNDNDSAFYWLAANENGREILADNLHLLPLVTAEALCHINLNDNDSAFYWLVEDEYGYGRKILAGNLHLLKTVTQQALCNIHSKYNNSAFFHLVSNQDDFDLLKNNPYMLKMVTPEALCCIDNIYHSSSFYWLTTWDAGMKILTSNTHLLSMLNKEALYNAQIDDHDSAFYNLATDDISADNASIKILQQIFECNTQLAHTITLEELKAPIKLDYNLVTTMYDILSKTAEGQSVLDKLPCTHHSNDKKRKIENITSINETPQQITLNPSTFFQAPFLDAMDIVENQPVTNIADHSMHYEDLAEPPVAKR